MNLKEIQDRLNQDKGYREAFLSNPVSFFKKEGVVLPEQAEKRLVKLVDETRQKKEPVPGASIGDKTREDAIMIEITKDF